MKQIILSNIQVLPYSEASEAARCFPGDALFNDRNDFILFKQQKAVAVLLTFRPLLSSLPHESVTATYNVRLVDTTSHRNISDSDVTVHLDAWEKSEQVRIDLPFEHDAVKEKHRYEVRVCEDRKIISQHPLRFFRFTTFFRRDYEVKWAALRDCNEHYTAIDCINSMQMEAVFRLEKKGALDKRMPEFWLRTVGDNGDETMSPCRYELMYDEDGKPDTTFTISAPLNIRHLPWGTTYCELQFFGIAIAGIVFEATDKEEEGFFRGEDTNYLADYYPYMGTDILYKRKDKALPSEEEEEEDEEEVDSTGWRIDFPDDEEEDEEEEVNEEEEEEEEAPAEDSHDSEDAPAEDNTEEEPAREKLERMIGLGDVKAKLTTYTQLMTFAAQRRKAGLTFLPLPLHALFLGAPGTGKTTVAKIMGQMLKEAGVLTSGHVVVRERAMLTGSHYGDEEEKTLKALEEAEGGILFIDEAYQLHQPGDPKDPGHFVLDSLMTALADEKRRNWMLILAGYTKPMLRMMELNPGLASRIPETNHYHFEDYTPRELYMIAESWLQRNQYMLTPHAIETLKKRLEHDYAERGDDFGNARHVINIIETSILPAMARRVASIESPTREDLQLIHACDIRPVAKQHDKPQRRVIGFTA